MASRGVSADPASEEKGVVVDDASSPDGQPTSVVKRSRSVKDGACLTEVTWPVGDGSIVKTVNQYERDDLLIQQLVSLKRTVQELQTEIQKLRQHAFGNARLKEPEALAEGLWSFPRVPQNNVREL